MLRYLRQLLPLFLIITCLTGLQPAPVWGASGETGSPRVLKIGLSEYPRYGYKDGDGTVAGIDVEYAYRIAQYANLKAQIVLIPDAETYFK